MIQRLDSNGEKNARVTTAVAGVSSGTIDVSSRDRFRAQAQLLNDELCRVGLYGVRSECRNTYNTNTKTFTVVYSPEFPDALSFGPSFFKTIHNGADTAYGGPLFVGPVVPEKWRTSATTDPLGYSGALSDDNFSTLPAGSYAATFDVKIEGPGTQAAQCGLLGYVQAFDMASGQMLATQNIDLCSNGIPRLAFTLTSPSHVTFVVGRYPAAVTLSLNVMRVIWYDPTSTIDRALFGSFAYNSYWNTTSSFAQLTSDTHPSPLRNQSNPSQIVRYWPWDRDGFCTNVAGPFARGAVQYFPVGTFSAYVSLQLNAKPGVDQAVIKIYSYPSGQVVAARVLKGRNTPNATINDQAPRGDVFALEFNSTGGAYGVEIDNLIHAPYPDLDWPWPNKVYQSLCWSQANLSSLTWVAGSGPGDLSQQWGNPLLPPAWSPEIQNPHCLPQSTSLYACRELTQGPELVGFTTENAARGYDTRTFITSLYRVMLGREAASNEVLYHLAAQTSAPTLSRGLYFSDEHLARMVREYYRVFLRREAEPSGLAYHLQAMKNGSSVENELVSFLASGEYYMKSGGGENFIRALYRDLLARNATLDDISYWTARVGDLAGRVAMAKTLVASDEARAIFVRGVYAQYLGVTPAQREVEDRLAALRAGATREQMEIAFASSLEFQSVAH